VYEGSWVQQFNDAGYSVCGVDNQGCGRSSGLFGYVERFDDYADDMLAFVTAARATDLAGFGRDLPTFGLGCSLGGSVVLRAALKRPDAFDGLLLLAPMVSLERLQGSGCNAFLMPLGRLLNVLVPTWPLVRTSRNALYPDLQRDFESSERRFVVLCVCVCVWGVDLGLAGGRATAFALLVRHYRASPLQQAPSPHARNQNTRAQHPLKTTTNNKQQTNKQTNKPPKKQDAVTYHYRTRVRVGFELVGACERLCLRLRELEVSVCGV
jgi:pimeloyl-ACP methyl ester carboxylesterase